MKQSYYISPKDSTDDKPLEPKQDTIRKILEYSRTLKIIKTKSIMVEVRLN